MKIIEFLNQYEGAFIALLTFVMVVINIVLLLINSKQLKQLKIQWKESKNPLLSVTIDGISATVFFKIVNHGGSTAMNVRIEFDKFLIDNNDGYQKEWLESLKDNGISIERVTPHYISTFKSYDTLSDRQLTLIIRYK